MHDFTGQDIINRLDAMCYEPIGDARIDPALAKAVELEALASAHGDAREAGSIYGYMITGIQLVIATQDLGIEAWILE